ncbi:MAG: hypothetical protein PWQ67_2209 [Clostridia bacterium]|nr:hypothetical protein [Clostridia bacterium]MDN5323755.1 hypothetical protein [Clostridia bacterium]
MDLKSKVLEFIDANQEELKNISDYIFDNPELAFEEYKAVEILTEKLKENGFTIEKGIAGLPTAFKAEYRGEPGGPVVALLAEYDALPEIGHACGHNLIATISVGAAIAISKVLSPLPGTLVVLGTPAEEGGGGKVIMVEKGCFTDVDCAMIIHPADQTMVDDISLANTNLVFTYHGKAAHAAAFPEKGINALDAAILTFNNINALRGHLKDDVRIHGIITKGGVATNIVTELAEAKFSVRALKRKELEPVVEKVCQCAKAAALATGAGLEIKTEGLDYDEIMNNKVLTSLLRENYLQLGEFVGERTIEQGLGSTDMGNVTQVVPGFQSYIGIGKDLVTHTLEFAQSCKGPAGYQGLITATKALAMTVLDLLVNPDLLKEAKEEFRKTKEE